MKFINSLPHLTESVKHVSLTFFLPHPLFLFLPSFLPPTSLPHSLLLSSFLPGLARPERLISQGLFPETLPISSWCLWFMPHTQRELLQSLLLPNTKHPENKTNAWTSYASWVSSGILIKDQSEVLRGRSYRHTVSFGSHCLFHRHAGVGSEIKRLPSLGLVLNWSCPCHMQHCFLRYKYLESVLTSNFDFIR